MQIMLELLGMSRNSRFAGLCSQIDGLEWIAKKSFGWQSAVDSCLTQSGIALVFPFQDC